MQHCIRYALKGFKPSNHTTTCALQPRRGFASVFLKQPNAPYTQSHTRAFSSRTAASEANAKKGASLREFAALGVRQTVLAGMRKFPEVQTPSTVQAAFIPHIIRGESDVFIRDGAGAGKSFGVIAALLSKQRAAFTHDVDVDRDNGNMPKRMVTTSIVIVPHTSLAFQLLEWIRIMTSDDLPDLLPSIAQAISRDDGLSPAEHAKRLASNPPHILIATPGALLDVWSQHQHVFQPRSLRTIVLDEADYLLGFGQRSAKTPTQAPRLHPHVSDARRFLDELFESRPKCVPVARYAGQDVGKLPLQLVLTSATFPQQLRNFVRLGTQWLEDSPRALVQVGFTGVDEGDIDEDNVPAGLVLGGPGLAAPGLVKHHCLVISKTGDAADLDISEEQPVAPRKPKKTALFARRGAQPSSVPDAKLLECVAACVALDVEKLAILVLDQGVSMRAVVAEMQEMGVRAVPLDLARESQAQTFLRDWDGEVTLLLATRATTRGIDLPVSHVFIIGSPENAFQYRHFAGRVGRRGLEGRVVQVIDSANDAEKDRMRDIYRRLAISPEKYEPGEG